MSSNLTPPNSVSGATTSGSGSGSEQTYHSAPAKIVNLPSALQNLSQNVMLGARLVGANSDGSVVLRTARGDLTLNVPIGIPPGASVQVQLQPGNPPSAVVILAGSNEPVGANMGGKSPPNVQMPGLELPASTTQTAATTAAVDIVKQAIQQLPDLKLNVVVRALVMEAVRNLIAQAPNASSLGSLLNKPEVLADMLEQIASKNGNLQNAQAELMAQLGAPGKIPNQVGTLSLPGKLLETIQQTIALLQQQPGGAKGLSNDQTALLQLLQSGSGTQAMPPQAGSQLFPGTELNLKLLQIIPPQPGTNNPTLVTILPNAVGIAVSGQITSQLVNGQPVMQTDNGNILLHATNKLPPGTTLVFELMQNMPVTSAPVQTLLDALKSNSGMPKLEQAMLMLNQMDQEMFQSLLNTMPKLNGQFPVTTLFFLQALRTGEVRNWLGDKALQGLRRGGPEGTKILEELTNEFSKISAKSKEVVPGEWRQMTIPYLGEQGMASIRLAVRDHYQPVGDDDNAPSEYINDQSRVTRFLFDLNFSELGAMQIDGLMRPVSGVQKQLDIVLRTKELLTSDMRRELREVFAESLSTYGMQGGLSFQAGFQNWIRLAEERSAGAKV